MNKQEAIKKIYTASWNDPDYEGLIVNAETVNEIIFQIDEPQKVVVPKFVAEWIEIHKKSFAEASAIDMYDNLTLDNSNGYYHDVWLWVVYHHYDFIRAWHEGYEVEQEKLYTVEIPDPNSRYTYRFLSKNDRGVFINGSCDDCWKDYDSNQLTESEIKQDFEWAWQWAEPVEEN